MARLPFEEITFRNQNRPKKVQELKPKEHTGLDTETLNGYVRLLCDNQSCNDTKSPNYCKDNQPLLLINSKNNHMAFAQIIKYLTKGRFEGKFNWFFNIQFDFESIIKYLDESDIIDLYNDGLLYFTIEKDSYNPISKKETNMDNVFRVEYLTRKYFGIAQNHHVWHFYDLFNFMDVSLNTASKKYLGETKNTDIDSSRLNLDLGYWNDYQDSIIKYCIQDCKLTQKLAVKFWDIMHKNLKLIPKRPFSKGKLSEEYFLKKCNIPTIDNFYKENAYDILEFAYRSFFGGRFELLKKGYFEKVYCYDIKSAYPSIMKDLIDFDFQYGTWQRIKNKDLTPYAYEGWYNVTVDSNEIDFSPVVSKNKFLNFYPNGNYTQYLLKSEIDFIRENFDNTTIKINSGVEFIKKYESPTPFKEEIERLYEWKNTEKDEDIKYVVKIILNSIYGKTIQVSQNKENTIGNLFNPMYASIITAKTRLKLLELGLQKPESVIMFSTDGLHTTEKLKVSSKPQLGDFDFEFEGEGVYIMSDVYNIWNNKKIKNKIRGFSAGSAKDIDSEKVYLKDILETMRTPIYKYYSERPIHLAESLIHNKIHTKNDINIWQKVEKEINVNGDMKRVWSKEFKSGKECLKIQIDSLPHRIGVD